MLNKAETDSCALITGKVLYGLLFGSWLPTGKNYDKELKYAAS